MNKKEINEIKKNFNDDCGFFTVNHVVTAFVDAPAAAGHGNGGRRRCVQAGCRHRGRAGNASGSIL